MEKKMTKWFPQKVGGNSHFENAKRAKEVIVLTEDIMLKNLAGKSTKRQIVYLTKEVTKLIGRFVALEKRISKLEKATTKHDGDNKEIVMVIDASKARIVNLKTGKFRIVDIWSDAQWKDYVAERVNEKLQ